MADDRPRWKEGDMEPPIEGILEYYDEQARQWLPLPLEGKTIRLLAEETRTKRRFGGAARVTDAQTSAVAYDPLATDLTAGDWRYEWEVTGPDGKPQTVPRDSYLEFTVLRKSGAAA